ncbi:MAG: lytic transglycosylase domain-containing protein [Plesiomonas shigelloides]
MIPSAGLGLMTLALLMEQCAPNISPVTLDAIIKTESSGNPYVVANIDDGTSHKFKSQPEATRYINALSRDGKRFSAGLMQIYSGNFPALGLDNNTVFDSCTNIKAGAKILTNNYESIKEGNEQEKLNKALSMYYSGNKTRGLKKEPEYANTSYVERVRNKAYKVPALRAEPTNNNRSAIVENSTKNNTQQWDVFGDFNNGN